MITEIVFTGMGMAILCLAILLQRQKVRARRREQIFANLLKNEKKLNKIMDTFTNESGIERVLIFECEPPEIGKELKVHCVYEGPGTDGQKTYESVTVDDHYVQMLLNLKEKKILKYIVEDMPFGLLKRIYLAEGIRYAAVFFIGDYPTLFLYGSIATKDDSNIFNDLQKDVAVELTVSALADIVNKIKVNQYGFGENNK